MEVLILVVLAFFVHSMYFSLVIEQHLEDKLFKEKYGDYSQRSRRYAWQRQVWEAEEE
jgi:hypothetical protein